MELDISIWMFCLVISSFLLFLTVYMMIILSDLESDYLNSRDCASRLNLWVFPRILMQVSHSAALLIGQNWTVAFLSLPFTCLLLYRRGKQKPGHSGLFDPTEIHNRLVLRQNLMECLGYMAYHLVSFFLYMYFMVGTLTGGDPTNPAKDVPW
eukprot:TRINITY_DN4366_c0_g1_i1.p1 TRINITY_DN4366_c0_g1~~TRINITY_DN4366_c0_g1_i1.p1  ORF type:complete len:153 (+),score=4.30 TRINITY_DN4366_c0_g1_i1:42-500(+)